MRILSFLWVENSRHGIFFSKFDSQALDLNLLSVKPLPSLTYSPVAKISCSSVYFCGNDPRLHFLGVWCHLPGTVSKEKC